MQKLIIEDLAPCLKKSKLCKEFGDDDSKSVVIPNKYMMDNFIITKVYTIKIKDNQELIKTLDNLRYWMIDELPYEIYDYIKTNYKSIHDKKILDDFKDFYYTDFNFLINYQLELSKDKSGYHDEFHVTNEAAKTGSISLLKYLFSKKKKFSWYTCSTAIEHDHNDLLKFLHKSFGTNFRNEDVYKYTHNTGDMTDDNDRACGERSIKDSVNAVKNGNLKMFKYVRNGNDAESYEIIETICEYITNDKKKYFDILQYALKKKYPISHKAYSHLAKNGDVEHLKFLHDYYLKIVSDKINHVADDWTVATTNCAAGHGKLDCLKFLCENGCACDQYVYMCACKDNNLECVKYLVEKEFPYSPQLTNYVATNCSFAILKYLYEHDFPMLFDNFLNAATVGNLEMLQYMHTHRIKLHVGNAYTCFASDTTYEQMIKQTYSKNSSSITKEIKEFLERIITKKEF